LSAVLLNNFWGEVGQLHERVIAVPHALHEVLAEVHDGLEVLADDFLLALALLEHLVELHAHLEQHLEVGRHSSANIFQVLSQNLIFNRLLAEHVAQNEEQRLQVQVLSLFADSAGEQLLNLIIVLNFLLSLDVSLAFGSNVLEFESAEETQGHILEEVVFVQFAAVPPLVLEKDADFVFVGVVCKVEVREAGDHHQQNEKGAR